MKQEPRPVSAGNPRPSGRGEVNAGSTRQQAIDAIGAQLRIALRVAGTMTTAGALTWTALAEAAYAAAEPLIRADQREQDAQLRGAYHALYEAWENGTTVEIDLPGYNGISYSDTLALDEASDAVSGLLRAQS